MKKTAYISISMEEFEALFNKASCQEIALYLLLKKQANFKTGEVGGFSPINYQWLADRLSRPKRNTAPAEEFDRGKARDLVARLQTIGLVANARMEGERLRLSLPFSPIDPFAKAPPAKPTPTVSETAKPQQSTVSKLSQTRTGQGFTEEELEFLSTDNTDILQYDQDLTTTHTDNTEQGEDTSPSVAQSDLHPHPVSKGWEEERTTRVGKANPSPADIHKRLSEAGGFRMLELPRTMRICADIASMVADLSAIDTAIMRAKKDGGDLTAGTIYNLVRDSKNALATVGGTGRGKVAL